MSQNTNIVLAMLKALVIDCCRFAEIPTPVCFVWNSELVLGELPAYSLQYIEGVNELGLPRKPTVIVPRHGEHILILGGLEVREGKEEETYRLAARYIVTQWRPDKHQQLLNWNPSKEETRLTELEKVSQKIPAPADEPITLDPPPPPPE